VERWTPRRICFSVTSVKKRSTRSTQELAARVKRTRQLAREPEPFSDRWSFVGGVIVHDQANVEIGRDIAFDLAQETQELAPSMARIATFDDLRLKWPRAGGTVFGGG
jgi:hypothetical protein